MNSVIQATVSLKRKSDQTIVIPIYIKGLNNNMELMQKESDWTTVEKIEVSKRNVTNRI